MDVKAEILSKIKPSAKEEERVKKFVVQLQRVAKTVSGLEAVMVGSIGKFTWLSGDHDIDVFLLFDTSVPRDELERLGLEYGKRIADEMGGKWKVKYAEHPYTHAVVKGFDVDIVPCYRINYGDRIKSSVDRSPLHLRYVLDHVRPAMLDEIRLLKQFCKGAGVYGSDAKNQGFSGYICELLILNYKNFDSVIDAAAGWKPPFTINFERHLGVPLSRFRNQSLVIIDPTDPNRNVAAVVSAENFVRFIAAARRYRKNPSAKFFFPEDRRPLSAAQAKSLQRRETRFLAIQMKRPDVIDDVLYPQLRSAVARLASLLNHNEFAVYRSFEFAEKKPIMVFEMETWHMPAVNNMVGPMIFSEKHSKEFLSKYSKNHVYIEDNRWVADVQRKHKTAVDLLNSFLKHDPKDLAEKGIPKYIAANISGTKVADHKEFFRILRKDKSLSDHVRKKYFVDDSNDFMR